MGGWEAILRAQTVGNGVGAMQEASGNITKVGDPTPGPPISRSRKAVGGRGRACALPPNRAGWRKRSQAYSSGIVCACGAMKH